ncbi:MAG: 7-cyano-7-deazaguanine synthase QueC, partial [Thermoplasmata archaeon]|nr:7-cyano-7-deazaguanine synthase QueC [Thermoplasmata archaeon]
MEKRAVVLLSGGLDSSVTAAYARSKGYSIYALTVIYGQTHSREIESAKSVAKYLKAEEHRIIELPPFIFQSSALLGAEEIPTDRRLEEIPDSSIPPTYVPARNIVLLSIASAWAESVGAEAVFIGVNALDYSGYPDCRPEFIEAFQEVLKRGTKAGVEGRAIKIVAPLINMSKGEIVRLGHSLGLDFSLTWSCYKGGERACGVCDSCKLRIKGFKEAGLKDPIP